MILFKIQLLAVGNLINLLSLKSTVWLGDMCLSLKVIHSRYYYLECFGRCEMQNSMFEVGVRRIKRAGYMNNSIMRFRKHNEEGEKS